MLLCQNVSLPNYFFAKMLLCKNALARFSLQDDPVPYNMG
jgi:hypothetical protein